MDLQFQHSATTVLDSDSIQIDSERFSKVAARAYARIAKAWKLPNAVAASLIGVSLRTWESFINEDWTGRLEQDQLRRISAIVGLYKALHLYFSAKLANKWVTLANTGQSFGGKKPINLMLDGGFPAIMKIRNYVEALRGGL